MTTNVINSLFSAPRGVVGGFLSNRYLIGQMSKRQILARYRTSALGFVWHFGQPLVLLGLYTFFFGVVLRRHWVSPDEPLAEFAIILFAGLLVFNFFRDCVAGAPALIVSNVNYVKKVVFPLEILSWVSIAVALFNWAVSILVLVLFTLVAVGSVPWTVVFLPLVIAPMVPLGLGLSWFLSSFGVFVRDVDEIISLLLGAALFLSPVFYPMNMLPERYETVFRLNPLVLIIEQTRIVALDGQLPDFAALGVYTLVSLVVAVLGYIWFQKTRRGFGDVL